MADVKDIRNPSLTIRISPEMNDRLDRVADMYGVTRGEIVRIAIGQYVGQITGAFDQMIKNSQVTAQNFDLERMIELMVPKMIEAFSEGNRIEGEVDPALVEQGRTAP